MFCIWVVWCVYANLSVLLIVQWLGVGVAFADERINQQQKQHVEQQCTHNRQVDDDGHLGQTD